MSKENKVIYIQANKISSFFQIEFTATYNCPFCEKEFKNALTDISFCHAALLDLGLYRFTFLTSCRYCKKKHFLTYDLETDLFNL